MHVRIITKQSKCNCTEKGQHLTFFIIIIRRKLTYVVFKAYSKYSLYVKKQNKRINMGNQSYSHCSVQLIGRTPVHHESL